MIGTRIICQIPIAQRRAIVVALAGALAGMAAWALVQALFARYELVLSAIGIGVPLWGAALLVADLATMLGVGLVIDRADRMRVGELPWARWYIRLT